MRPFCRTIQPFILQCFLSFPCIISFSPLGQVWHHVSPFFASFSCPGIYCCVAITRCEKDSDEQQQRCGAFEGVEAQWRRIFSHFNTQGGTLYRDHATLSFLCTRTISALCCGSCILRNLLTNEQRTSAQAKPNSKTVKSNHEQPLDDHKRFDIDRTRPARSTAHQHSIRILVTSEEESFLSSQKT